MGCDSDIRASNLCPTVEQMHPQLLALLPRGRAWQTHDGGPRPGTALWKFWRAIAVVATWIDGRICALADEWHCHSMSETRDDWLTDYGLPDGCDPWPDICAKVAATGGATPAYYEQIAAAAGWAITVTGRRDSVPAVAGQAQPACWSVGPSPAAGELVIYVDLDASAAYGGGGQTAAQPGAIQPGMALACPPDISPVVCLIERIAHAATAITWITTAAAAA